MIKPLTTIVREVLNLPPDKTLFNDVTSKNRRRIKIWGWVKDELSELEIKALNIQLIQYGWIVFDHSFWKPDGYRRMDYVIRIEKVDILELPIYPINGPMVDFNFLSEHGILHRINTDVLHPLGLALTRDGGISKGCLISPDLKWEYSEDIQVRNEKKFAQFITNREEILTPQLKD